MSAEIQTGLDALRAAVVARNKAPHVIAHLARDLGIGTEALYSFALGTTTLAPDVLRALAVIVYHGHAEFDPALNLLKPAPKAAPRVLGGHLPPFDASASPWTYKPGTPSVAPRPLKATKPVVKTPKPGWAE